MRIILTGSNGLLGQKIVTLLANKADIELIASAKGENRLPLQGGYTYEDADLTDKARWEQLFAQYRPDVLISSGAMTQVDVCEDEREMCDRVNVEAVAHFCQLCKQYGTHLVHISTDFIFDGEKTDGYYDEADTPNPVNYYGLSKLKAEEVIAKAGVNVAILRTILLYGVVGGLSRSNIVLWVKQSLEAGKRITVVNDQMRCPTLAEDLTAATVSAALRKATGIFHVCGPERMTILALAKRVARFWKLDESLIGEIDSPSLNQRAKRPPRTAFRLDKAQKLLGYQPHGLEEGLAILDEQLAAYQN